MASWPDPEHGEVGAPWPRPAAPNRLIGRSQEVEELAAQLRGPGRSVTLVGPPGVGKSRLALALGDEFATGAVEAVWWIDIALLAPPEGAGRQGSIGGSPDTDAADALAAADELAASIGAGARSPRLDTVGRLAEGLRERPLLLVLDNAERSPRSVALIVAALTAPGSEPAVLVTSRVPLGHDGERLWTAPSLAVPPPGVADPERRTAAVQLFWERVEGQAVAGPGGASPADAAAASELCRRLDGMALAIELTAARCRSFSPGGLLALVDGQAGTLSLLDVLAAAPASAPDRQATMRAALAWSHGLLNPAEQAVFRRLAVFRSGFDVDALLGVIVDEELSGADAVDGLDALVRHSLVQRTATAGSPGGGDRFRLLDLVAEFAAEALRHAGETATFRRRHAEWYAALSTRRTSVHLGLGLFQLVDRLGADRANVLAAAEALLEAGDADRAAEMVSELRSFWIAVGALAPAASLLRRAEALGLSSGERRRALVTRGYLRFAANDIGAAIGDALAALAVDEPAEKPAEKPLDRSADRSAVAAQLLAGPLLCWAGDPLGERLLLDAVAIARQLEDRTLLAEALTQQAAVALLIGERVEVAEPLLAEAERSLAENDETTTTANWHLYRAILRDQQGRPLPEIEHLDALLADPNAALSTLRAGATMVRTRTALLVGAPVPSRAELDAWRREADRNGEFSASVGFGIAAISVAISEGDHAGAAQLADELTKRLRAAGLAPHAANARGDGIGALCVLGDRNRLRRAIDELRELADGIGSVTFQQRAALGEVWLHHLDGHPEAAIELLQELLATTDPRQRQGLVLDQLDALTVIQADLGAGEDALIVAGAVQRARRGLGLIGRRSPFDVAVPSAIERARQQLGAEDAAVAWRAGERLGLVEIVAFVRRARGTRGRPRLGWESLTPAERSIAEIIATGATNAEIAARLLMSRDTVKTHLKRTYAKLGITSRAELAALQARSG